MECSTSAFLFRKLRHTKYVVLEIMMFVAHYDSWQFLFSVNKETRAFLSKNIITIQNGFMNEGLIEFKMRLNDYNDYEQLERLYFQIINRAISNRKLTIEILFQSRINIVTFN